MFELRANITFLTLKTLFWHSYWRRISYFDIQNPIVTLKLRPNIEIRHSNSYFDIVFWHSTCNLTSELGMNILFGHSKSYIEIRAWAEYRILTLKFLFWHSNWRRISYFDIQNPIVTLKLRPNIEIRHSNSYFDIVFWHSTCNLTPQFGMNILFGHSKSYIEIRARAEYHILTLKFLYWHSNWRRILYFDIQNPILIFELRPNIVFWHSIPILSLELGPNITFWRSNPILTFKLGRKIVFWHSKFFFDIPIDA